MDDAQYVLRLLKISSHALAIRRYKSPAVINLLRSIFVPQDTPQKSENQV
jgi:hypothetical protein